MTKTRRSVSLVAAAALLLGLAAPAMAQSPGSEPARPAKVKQIIITEGETIEKDVPTGQIIGVDARGFAKRDSLIKYRYSFVDKIYQSAENI